MLVRRERPHPGAQLSFTDHDGYRFQATLTDQPDPDIAELERRHRARAGVEDHIRNDKDTGLRNLPFRDFEHNRVWLQLVLLAHDLLAWTQRLLLDRRTRALRTQTAALPAAAHRRAPRLPRPHRDAAPPSLLALGRRTRRRVRPPQSAARPGRLTPARPPREDHQHRPAPAPGEPLPAHDRPTVPHRRPSTPTGVDPFVVDSQAAGVSWSS